MSPLELSLDYNFLESVLFLISLETDDAYVGENVSVNATDVNTDGSWGRETWNGSEIFWILEYALPEKEHTDL